MIRLLSFIADITVKVMIIVFAIIGLVTLLGS